MRDDEMMDGMLRTAMSGRAPEVSPTFERDVMRRTAPRRLTVTGRVVVCAYALASVALCAWVLRDLPVAITALALVVEAVAAVALRIYTSNLAHS